MTKILEEIKDEIAVEASYKSWSELMYINKRNTIAVENAMDEVSIRYAREVAQASLERASKVAKTFRNGNSGSYLDASIDKKSITQESNIVML